MHSSSGFLACLPLLLASGPGVSLGDEIWSTAPHMLYETQDSAAVMANGKLYIIGGAILTSTAAEVQVYDGTSWEVETLMPTPRIGMAAAAVGNTIYAIGGSTLGPFGNAVDIVEAYDAQAGTWTSGAPMPTARYLTAGAVVNGTIYVVGGRTAAGPDTDAFELYDTALNQWTVGPPLSLAREALTAVATNGMVYALGGAARPSTTRLVEVFDTNQPDLGWTRADPLPHVRYNFMAAVGPDDRIYVIGGQPNWASVERYEPVWDSWDVFTPPLPTPRYALAGATFNGAIYAAGGVSGLGLHDDVEQFTPVITRWTPVTTIPLSKRGARLLFTTAAGDDGRIYLIGGMDDCPFPPCDNVLDTVDVYEPFAGTWSTGARMPTARRRTASTVGPDRRIYVVGGETLNVIPLNTAEAFDPASGTWAVLPPMPTPRTQLAVASANRRIYAMGGLTSPPIQTVDVVEEYDPIADAWIPTADMSAGRREHTATLLPDGRVLATGGDGSASLATAELYSP